MKFKSVKRAVDLVLDGIGFDCEWRDGSLVAVSMMDAKGNVVRVAMDGYSMHAYVPAPPEKKTVHVVSGTVRVAGTQIREEFDEAHDARSRKSELEQADVCDSVTVAQEEIAIPF